MKGLVGTFFLVHQTGFILSVKTFLKVMQQNGAASYVLKLISWDEYVFQIISHVVFPYLKIIMLKVSSLVDKNPIGGARGEVTGSTSSPM